MSRNLKMFRATLYRIYHHCRHYRYSEKHAYNAFYSTQRAIGACFSIYIFWFFTYNRLF